MNLTDNHSAFNKFQVMTGTKIFNGSVNGYLEESKHKQKVKEEQLETVEYLIKQKYCELNEKFDEKTRNMYIKFAESNDPKIVREFIGKIHKTKNIWPLLKFIKEF